MLAIGLFTIAAILAAGAILIAFKRFMNSLSTRFKQEDFDQKGIQKDQTKYFLHVALIEVIPIILIILGFRFSDENTSTVWIVSGLVLIIGIILISLVQIKKEKLEILADLANASPDIKKYMQSVVSVGYITTLGIPLISLAVIVFLYLL